MNSNDSEKLKKDLLRKLLTGEKLPTDLTFTQELSSGDQNIKYRSYTPWTTLRSVAMAYKDEFKISFNKVKNTFFETNDMQSQYIFDAAFIKCAKYISNDTEKDFSEVVDDMVNYLLKRHIGQKNLFEVVEILRKLRPEALEDV